MVKISVYNKGRLSKIDSLPLLYVLSLMQFLSAMVEEFLALLTRDNSTASSRSLMSGKPVTSLALTLLKQYLGIYNKGRLSEKIAFLYYIH